MALFFKPTSKVQKDKSILRTIDREIANKSLPGSFAYFGIYVLACLLVNDFGDNLITVYTIGMGILAIAAMRVYYILRFEELYARGPAKWRNQFLSLTLLNALVWASMQMVVLETDLLSHGSTIVLVFTAALSAGITIIFAAYRQFLKTYLSIILIPAAAILALNPTLESWVLSLGVLVFWAFLIRESKAFNRNFWEKVENQYLLEYKLTMINASRIEEGQRAEISENVLHTIMQLIKNPLQGVLGMLTLLKDSNLNKDQEGALELATQSGDALISLISDLEDFARIKSGNIQLESKFFDLRRFIEIQMEKLGGFAHQRGRELSFLYGLEVPSRVNLDKKHIGHVMQSQIQFAINSCDNGEIVFKVISDEHPKYSNVLKLSVFFRCSELEVSEVQAALDKKQMDNLHELDAGILSLIIAAKLVELMGGDMDLYQPKENLFKLTCWVPLRASSQQIDSFQPDKRLLGKSLMLSNMPTRAGKGLKKECENWGMNLIMTDGPKALKQGIGQNPDYLLYNLPITVDVPELLTDTFELRQWDLGKAKLIFYGTEKHKKFVASEFPNAAFLLKPSGRYALHRNLLENTDEEIEDLEVTAAGEKTILLAEDNEVNRMVTEGILKKLGYNFHTVEDGQQAVDALNKNQYDLILMDCMMPNLDGIEATKLIRQNEKAHKTDHTPIVALTAKNAESEERTCIAAGMDDFLSKPSTYVELEDTLRRWLR